MGQAAFEFTQPLGVDESLEDTPDLELSFLSGEPLEKTYLDDLVDMAVQAVHHFCLVGAPREKKFHHIGNPVLV
uniref:Uncharacterized protein n=1 Tax=Candidatus Kentrum sp. FW TaxID=2126338 RepID=A0A450TUU8_9GAMM|nr:MAG: hypothetical protein BECKFW1821C_GA0114237_103723 [Candidatus Kentron sp. FW]